MTSLNAYGDSSYTLSELAFMISQKAGKQVIYQNMPQSEFEAVLVSISLPAVLAALLADSDAAAAKGALHDDSATLSALIERPTIPVLESLTGIIL